MYVSTAHKIFEFPHTDLIKNKKKLREKQFYFQLLVLSISCRLLIVWWCHKNSINEKEIILFIVNVCYYVFEWQLNEKNNNPSWHDIIARDVELRKNKAIGEVFGINLYLDLG